MLFTTSKFYRTEVKVQPIDYIHWWPVYFLIITVAVVGQASSAETQSFIHSAGSSEPHQQSLDHTPTQVPVDKRNARVFCGSRLTDMLLMVCRGRFHERKRRQLVSLDTDGGASHEQLTAFHRKREEYDYVGSNADGYFSHNQRNIILQRRAGAASECCLQPCAVSQMVAYCHPDVQKNHPLLRNGG